MIASRKGHIFRVAHEIPLDSTVIPHISGRAYLGLEDSPTAPRKAGER
jgi:hypothetical protein